jgi:hypothetical protein
VGLKVAWTQADLDGLDRAIASGVLTSRTADGKSVTFVSLDRLLAARNLVARALGQTRAPAIGYYSPDGDYGDTE